MTTPHRARAHSAFSCIKRCCELQSSARITTKYDVPTEPSAKCAHMRARKHAHTHRHAEAWHMDQAVTLFQHIEAMKCPIPDLLANQFIIGVTQVAP